MIVPAVIGVPSPQSIVAVKSAIDDEPVVGTGLASVNTATGPLKSWPGSRVPPNTGTGKVVASIRVDRRLDGGRGERRVGDDGRAGEDGRRSAVIGHRDAYMRRSPPRRRCGKR